MPWPTDYNADTHQGVETAHPQFLKNADAIRRVQNIQKVQHMPKVVASNIERVLQ